MATFGEVVYMVLDVLKERSDDAYYTEEHIIFLASKMRAFLLERKYAASRNKSFEQMSEENTQTICLNLEPTELIPDGCAGLWLKSTEKIPDTLGGFEPKLYTVSDAMHTMLTYIPIERMPYVGYNKWLKNIIYAAKSSDGYLYATSNNPQFIYLQNARMEAVFSNVEEAAELACEGEDGTKCDILDQAFPLESALIPSCIEMVVQELAGSRYAPEDKDNNAKDDFSEAAVTQRPSRPAESVASRRSAQEAE